MLLAWAKGKDNRVRRRRCGQKKAEHFVAQRWSGIRVIAMVLGPHAPDTQTSKLSIFSFYFNGLQRFTKLATSSYIALPQVSLHRPTALARAPLPLTPATAPAR